MNLSTTFFNNLEELWKKEIPNRVLERARESLLDYIAVTCAGAKFQKEKLDNYCSFFQPETGDYKIIGAKKKATIKDAVFFNGLNSHALDYDDGTNAGIIHLGSPIFSLLLPLAQKYGICKNDLLKSVIIGYEASFTLAVSIQPKHKSLGFHATGTCGTIGAALAAAYMLNFEQNERFQVFSAACVASSGILKVLDDGSELKPYNVAKAALLALTSLQIAKAGFKGSLDPLGGRGFFKMMTGNEDVILQPMLLNGTYAIEKRYIKPYASCRYTHPAVEAAIKLKTQGVEWKSIQKVTIITYSLAVYGHDHTDILGSYSAKMSIPYSVAVGLIFGNAGLREFDEEIVHNEAVKHLTKKIHVMASEEYSKVFPNKQIATIIVDTFEKQYSSTVNYPKGEPETPLTKNEFKERYEQLMEYAEKQSDNIDLIYKLVNKTDVLVKDIIDLI